MKKKNHCTYCRRELYIGVNAFGVREGVIGHERFVPLGELVLFCSEECVAKHFDGSVSVIRRIP